MDNRKKIAEFLHELTGGKPPEEAEAMMRDILLDALTPNRSNIMMTTAQAQAILDKIGEDYKAEPPKLEQTEEAWQEKEVAGKAFGVLPGPVQGKMWVKAPIPKSAKSAKSSPKKKKKA